MKNKILWFLGEYIHLKKGLAHFMLLFCVFSISAVSFSASAESNIQTQQGKRTVTGIVTDSSGEPLIGVTVREQGTTNGVITGTDGRYSISVSAGASLSFTYVGYRPSILAVSTNGIVNAALGEDVETLEELVVVGYGVQKKSDLTGALSRVTEDQIKQRPVQNALQAMQGKVPGVDITSNNRPGEIGDVRIRGNRSINASNAPLYVIDGIPLTSGSVADINPNDIASMEILKDASATAIYGSRGANGVVLVTTKRGVEGRMSINYDGSLVLSKIDELTDWMKAGDYLNWQRSAYINGGTYAGAYGTAPDPVRDRALFFGPESYMDRIIRTAYQLKTDGTPELRPATAEEKAMGYADMVPVYDSSSLFDQHWVDMVTRNAFTNNHQISLTSGTDKSKLYMSLGYLNQQSPMKDQDYERYNVSMNGDISPLKWFRMGMGLNLSHSIKNYGIVSNFSNTVAKDSYGLALGMSPYAPAFDENNVILDPRIGLSWHNLLLNIDEAINETRYYSAMLSSFAEIDLFPWMKWRTNFGTQFRNSREGSYYGEKFTNPFGFTSTEPNVGYNNQNLSLSWTLENLLFLTKTFNNIHSFHFTLMQSAEKFRSESLNVRAYEVTYPTSLWYNLGASNTSKVAFGSGYNSQTRASYMARLNYNLMEKYLLTLTGRYDGASMLAAGNKWDFFPSAALAWRVDQEPFIKNNYDWISQLKFRAGYGVTGNASVASYSTSGSMTSSDSSIPFGEGGIGANTIGAKANVMPNYKLGWEKTASTNFGLDFGLMKGRVSGSIEYYIANTFDLLMPRTLPPFSGYVNLQANIGKTRNRGLEVTLSTINIKTRDFTWQTDFTFSTNKEEIVELPGGKVDDKTNGWFIGKPIDEVWTLKYNRLWQNTDADKELIAIYKANGLTFIPGQGMVVDQEYIAVNEGTPGSKTVTLADGTKRTYMDNGFGVINNEDNQFLGSFQPKWIGGFNTSLTYKDWQLSTFVYARFGNLYYGLMQTYGRRVEKDVWSETNTTGKFPQPTTKTNTNYNGFLGYTSGDMVIVRNIALSYTVPSLFLTKIKLASAQAYVQVLNPFIFGAQLVDKGINPDDTTGWNTRSNPTNYIGGQTNNTAITRSFVFGLRFGI